MGSRRTNPVVVGLNYNPRTAISFRLSFVSRCCKLSTIFFEEYQPSLSLFLCFFFYLHAFIFSPLYSYSNNQVHLRENEFLRPRHIMRLCWVTSRQSNKSKEVLFSSVCESITAKFLITRRQETVANLQRPNRRGAASTPFIIYVLTRAISTTLDFHAFNCAWRELNRCPFHGPLSFFFVICNFITRGIVSIERSILGGKVGGRISSSDSWNMLMSQYYANYVYVCPYIVVNIGKIFCYLYFYYLFKCYKLILKIGLKHLQFIV